MSSLSWFSCSTGLQPDPGGGAEREEEEEELNQFTAAGLRRDKGGRTKVTGGAASPQTRQLPQRLKQNRVMTPVGGQWECIDKSEETPPHAAPSLLCVSPPARQASAYFSHTFTERKQMRGNYKSVRKRIPCLVHEILSGALVI